MKNIIELVAQLKTEKDCHLYFAAKRWADGVIECPHCNHDRVYVFKDQIRYKCCACNLNFTAKSKTFMEASKLPTIKWLVAMWLVLHKTGISSVQLAKDVGVTQKTAWFMLIRMRKVFGNVESEPLTGQVEIDETFIGGKNGNRHKSRRVKYNPGRSWSDKVPVFGMLQRKGQMRAVVIHDVSMLHIKKQVENHITIGTTLMADGFTGYKPLSLNYIVNQVDHARGSYVNGDCHTNTLESAWNIFKRSIRGNYCAPSKKHLQKYIDEFLFRYNNRNLDIPNQITCIIKQMNCRIKYKELKASA